MAAPFVVLVFSHINPETRYGMSTNSFLAVLRTCWTKFSVVAVASATCAWVSSPEATVVANYRHACVLFHALLLFAFASFPRRFG